MTELYGIAQVQEKFNYDNKYILWQNITKLNKFILHNIFEFWTSFEANLSLDVQHLPK